MLGLACAMVSSFKEPSGHADFSWMHPTVERIENHQSKQANSQVFCGSNIYIYSQRPHQDLPISCFNGVYAIKCVFPKPENGLLFSFHLKILKLKTFKNIVFWSFLNTRKNVSFDLGTGKGAVVYINHYFHYMIITLKKNPTKLTFYVMVSKPPYFLFVSLLYFLKIIQDKNQENIEKKQKLGPKTKKTSKKPKIWTRNQKNIEKNKILDQTPKKHRENQRNQRKKQYFRTLQIYSSFQES